MVSILNMRKGYFVFSIFYLAPFFTISARDLRSGPGIPEAKERHEDHPTDAPVWLSGTFAATLRAQASRRTRRATSGCGSCNSPWPRRAASACPRSRLSVRVPVARLLSCPLIASRLI